MNILFVFDNPIVPFAGGTERVTYTVANILKLQGHDVSFLSLLNNGEEGPNQYHLPNSDDWCDSRNIKYINKFIINKQIDLLINQNGYGESALLCNHEMIPCPVKIISAIHFSILDEYKYFHQRLRPLSFTKGLFRKIRLSLTYLRLPYLKYKAISNRRERIKYLLDKTDYVTVLSDKFITDIVKVVPDARSERIVTLPNPNSFIIGKEDIVKQKIVLWVGRFNYYEKRTDRILKIWRMIEADNQDWKLIVLGDGPEKNTLFELKDKLGLQNVEFLGKIEAEPFYKVASIICLTSNYEGFGMTLTEGMQYGAVPICFNSYKSASDIIDIGENGYLIKPFDLNDYAAHLNELMNNPKKLQTLSKNCQIKVRKFDSENISNLWQSFINEMQTKKDIDER